MLLLPVSDLLNRRDPIALDCDFPEIGEGCHLAGAITVWPNGSGFRLRGALQGEAQLICDRCLRAFSRPLAIQLDETFLVRAARRPHAEKHGEKHGDRHSDPIEEMNPEETLDERDSLDIADLARQWAVMETAGQRVCGDPTCAY
ncbi:MAG: DUF177 domain-containing protein [Vampirovibrionales bacterium]|nr:DUF177 domain-containing protein [Vampirovibrionales bacterium]